MYNSKHNMSALFFRYYIDVTKYNLFFCALYIIILGNLIEGIILFGTAGVLMSFIIYKYFHNIEYYFYINGGLSKNRLKFTTFVINLLISSLIITIWSIRYM